MSKLLSHIAALLVVFTPFDGFTAVDRSVSVNIDPKQILIGQPAQISIEIEVPSGGIIVWPDISKYEEKEIEVLRFGVPDTLVKTESSLRMRQVHRITAWKESYIALPPLEFLHIFDNDTVRFQSTAMLFEIQSVEVDMTDMIRDIKPIWNIPITFREILPYLLAAIGLGILILLIIKYLKRPKKVEEKQTLWEKPSVPAHIAAISSLETLRRKQLWQQGKTKQYHSELTFILRKYLLKRYGLDAVEMTTADIRRALPKYLADESLVKKFNEIFVMADLVKFAKHAPDEDEHEQSLEMALDFVKSTIPKEETSQ